MKVDPIPTVLERLASLEEAVSAVDVDDWMSSCDAQRPLCWSIREAITLLGIAE